MREKIISTWKQGKGLAQLEYKFDFVVLGAGPAGLAAAVLAARYGLKTALVNDRGCLGGNMSKEMQTTPIGAHYVDKNFIYRRETGLAEELILNNLYINPQNGVELWNLTMQTAVYREKNLELFLHLAIDTVKMTEDGKKIAEVSGYSAESEQRIHFRASFFADCTGNGTVAFLAGVPYMQGHENSSDFGEEYAGEGGKWENGCTTRLRAKDIGREVVFHSPDWVKYRFEKEDLEHRGLELTFMNSLTGFWWMEWGGALDTVTDMRQIRTELTHIAYAVWDYIKNRSSLREELRTYDLDWVSTMPGRRENRRFIGDYIYTQTDIDEQRKFYDSIAYGGFGYDDHARDGIFHKDFANTHTYHLGPFEVPLRCLYAKNVENLFLAGRNISVSHLGLCGIRNMWTCLQFGEAVAAAATVCCREELTVRQAADPEHIDKVHALLHRVDHTIFSNPYRNPNDLAQSARISASSTLSGPGVGRIDGKWPVTMDCCYLFPVVTKQLESLEILVDAGANTRLHYAVMSGRPKLSTIPYEVLKEGTVDIEKGQGVSVNIPCNLKVLQKGWHFLVISENPEISLCYGNNAPVGLKAMYRHSKENVENPGCIQITKNRDWDYMVDTWEEPSYCLKIYPEQPVYLPENVRGETARPTFLPNLWISQATDFKQPEYLEFEWDKAVDVHSIQLIFDSSLDNFLAVFQGDTNCQWGGYSANVIPSVVKDYRILYKLSEDCEWREAANILGNYQRFCEHKLTLQNVVALRVEILATNGLDRAQIYAVRILQ